MNTRILSVRVSRRALGAAVLTPEGLALADGRHLSSKTTKASVAASHYLERLLSTAGVTAAVIDAPEQSAGGVTAAVLERLRAMLAEKGVPVSMVGRSDLLVAYGLQPLRNRNELRDLVQEYWMDLVQHQGPDQAVCR